MTFRIKLDNDDIQDLDLRWEEALLLASDPPSDKVSGLCISKLQDSSQAQTLMALQIEQAQRSKNFSVQSEIAERAAVTKGKGQNSFTKRKESAFSGRQMGLVQNETLVVFPHSLREEEHRRESSLKPAVNNERRRKGKEQASSSVPTVKQRSTSLEARLAT